MGTTLRCPFQPQVREPFRKQSKATCGQSSKALGRNQAHSVDRVSLIRLFFGELAARPPVKELMLNT
jgi:hypothetical protein